jgi:hypothetical protein
VATHPDLTGVVVRSHWSELEPAEGRFGWSFDVDIEQARKAHKQVILGISQGVHTPSWVYDGGAKAFTFSQGNRFQPGTGERRQIPIPWDPVFLDKWTRFVKALGAKYAQDRTIVLVHMVGPSTASAEMHLPKSKEDQANWTRVGYSKDRLVGAWKTVIDAYDAAFPETNLALDVAVPVYPTDGVVEAVIAYASKKLGKRFHIQHDALSAKIKEDWRVHQWVVARRDGATVGFELLCPVTPRGKFNDEGRRFGGTLREAFQLGLKGGASYIQIYPVDLEHEATAKDIHALAKQLQR